MAKPLKSEVLTIAEPIEMNLMKLPISSKHFVGLKLKIISERSVCKVLHYGK